MKRNCLVLIFSFMLLLTASAFALTADVSMRINGVLPNGSIQMLVGADNQLEFWVTNSAKIKGMSLGFELSNNGLPYSLVKPYGNLPYEEDGGGVQTFDSTLMKEHGTANNFLNTFGLGGNAFDREKSTRDTIFFGGADASSGQTKNLLIHATTTLAYSVMIRIPAGQDSGSFCIRPIYVPPAGAWKMDAGTNPGGGVVNPDFQGAPTVSSADPGVNPVCFVRAAQPCPAVTFTTTPVLPVNQNHCTNYGFTFAATTTGGHTITGYTVTGTGASINAGGVLTVLKPTSGCGTTDVVVTATSDCNSTASFPFTITWTNNVPAITNCAALSGVVGMGNTYTKTVVASDPDPCDAVSFAVTSVDAVPGSFSINGLGQFSFVTTIPMGGDTLHFVATATDPCLGAATCEFTVEVLQTEPFGIQIQKVHNQLQGHYAYVSITQEAGSNQMGGYDFLISYDASALTFISAQLGAGPVACGWEYFTYRFGAQGNCGGPCPSGMLRIVAIADQNNGPHHPTCYGFAAGTELAQLKFYVTNDRAYNCYKADIKFAWMDCGDNAISNVGGDTLWIARDVYDYYGADGLDTYVNVTGQDCGQGFAITYTGFCNPLCLNPTDPALKIHPISFIDFFNGGVDIVCSDSIDARGDLNLNGLANEIADAVLYTNYFLHGISAFPVLGREGAIAASDVNGDGRTLTVGDLVYLLRIIVGDALPMPKLAPFASSATVNCTNGSVSTESVNEIGAVYATFAINGAYTVVSNTNMQVESAEANGELKVLVYSGVSNLSNRLASGSNELFTVTGNVELKGVEVADYNGNMLSTRVNKTALPTSFALSQNVPNPFNPTTKIGFALPNQTEWTLSIYNVAGQLVKNFSGNNVGNVNLEWDASMVPSGVYFYKLNAGSFSDTKKMVLMK